MHQTEDALIRELHAHNRGVEGALPRLVTLIYDDLRILARQQLRRVQPQMGLRTTSLVHEVYLKLVRQPQLSCSDRRHLLAIVACAMRQVVIDFARARSAKKRGAGLTTESLDARQLAVRDEAERMVELDQALSRLDALDPRLTKVVECRFYGGLSEVETAEALNVSRRTVQRDWLRAKAWLKELLSAG